MKNIIWVALSSALVISCNEGSKTKSTQSSNAASTHDTTRTGSEHVSSASLSIDSAKLKDSLANNPPLFLQVASKQLQWEIPAEPLHLVGPIYFVGTQGLASYLITTPKGHILLYTGMPSSGPMIEQSIKKLGFKPEDIKILLTGHAHIDHVGAFAYLKKVSGAQVAIMDREKELIESGGKTDFFYGPYSQFHFEPVQVDRVLHGGDIVQLGPIRMKAISTSGHTKGGTTWQLNVTDSGKTYEVVFPDGTSINPGYRIAVNPSYPGIEQNLRNTLHTLEMLHPNIWFSSHTDYFDFKAKRDLAGTAGVKAWVDPQGYQRRIASEKNKFEAAINAEQRSH